MQYHAMSYYNAIPWEVSTIPYNTMQSPSSIPSSIPMGWISSLLHLKLCYDHICHDCLFHIYPPHRRQWKNKLSGFLHFEPLSAQSCNHKHHLALCRFGKASQNYDEHHRHHKSSNKKGWWWSQSFWWWWYDDDQDDNTNGNHLQFSFSCFFFANTPSVFCKNAQRPVYLR